ncbi:hypothetical protein [Streptomyces sp. NPDC017988]
MGTAVGAVAAIGGLVFTGVATCFDARVAEGQPRQAREGGHWRPK